MKQNTTTAYDLTVMLPEEDASFVHEILADAGATDINEKITKVTFAYEVSGHDQGYMAVFTFSMDPSGADSINKTLKSNQTVLRHMLLRDTVKETAQSSRRKPKESSKPQAKAKKESDEPLSNEAIEQKIEEILD